MRQKRYSQENDKKQGDFFGIDEEAKNGNLISADSGKYIVVDYIIQGEKIRDAKKNRESKVNMTPRQKRRYERNQFRKAKRGSNFIK